MSAFGVIGLALNLRVYNFISQEIRTAEDLEFETSNNHRILKLFLFCVSSSAINLNSCYFPNLIYEIVKCFYFFLKLFQASYYPIQNNETSFPFVWHIFDFNEALKVVPT